MAESVNNQKTNDAVISVPGAVGSKEREPGASLVGDANPGPQIINGAEGFVSHSEAPVPHIPEVGLTASADATPVATEPTGAVSLPMTEREVEEPESSSSLNLHEIKEGEYIEDSRPFLKALIRKIYHGMRGLVRRPA